MFVALVPPEEAVEDLERFLAPRRDAASFRWAGPEQFHVTLAFLAEVAEHQLDELVERLGRAGKRRTAFPARVAGGGAFPNARAPVAILVSSVWPCSSRSRPAQRTRALRALGNAPPPAT